MTLLGVMTALLPARDVVPIHGVVQLASNFTRTLLLIRSVRWRVFAIYTLPYLIGIALATSLWSGAALEWFSAAIGVFLLAFLIFRRKKPKLRALPMWSYAPLGAATGFLAIFVGATGPFIAPFFLRDDFTQEETVATSAMCQSLGHVAKIPAFLALGYDFVPMLVPLAALIAASIIGTFFGRRVLAKLPRTTFTIVFEVTLVLIAAFLIWDGIAALSGDR
jgi:uncharacterized membrane protein YfcA